MKIFLALLRRSADAYEVLVPGLIGCTASGATLDEAVANATAAVRKCIGFLAGVSGWSVHPLSEDQIRADAEHAAALAAGAILAPVIYVDHWPGPAGMHA